MKKFCKLLALTVMVLVVGTTLTACGTVKLNNDDGSSNEETTPQVQWWVGTYDWVSLYLIGNPTEYSEQLFVSYWHRMCPSSTYGDTVVLTKDGQIIDTQWGCYNSEDNGTTYGTYAIDDTKNLDITYGTEEEIVIKRPATIVGGTDSYFIITESGVMLQLIGASENFALCHKLQKRSE